MTNQIIIGRKVAPGLAVAGWVLAGCRVPIQLRPTRVLQDDESFAVVFDGTYPGGPPLRAIAVQMTVRDSEGTYLGSGEVGILGDFTTAGYANIEPGDSFGLAVSAYLDPAFRNESLDNELYAVGSLAQP